jgi:hypothetical protein
MLQTVAGVSRHVHNGFSCFCLDILMHKSFGYTRVLEGVGLVLLPGEVYHPQPRND